MVIGADNRILASQECHDQRLMVTRDNGQIKCYAVPVSLWCHASISGSGLMLITHVFMQDAFTPDSSRDLPPNKHSLNVYKDKDGSVWCVSFPPPQSVRWAHVLGL